MGKDIKGYYATLQLEKNATNIEIKKAYRNLARIHHPDKDTGDESVFRKIQEAYDTLSDETKRTMYDRDIDSEQEIHVDVFDLGDIFKNMFNFEERDIPRTSNDQVIDLSLDDVVYGCTKIVQYQQEIKCKKCDGHGHTFTGVIHCMRCNGQGYIPSVSYTHLTLPTKA